MSFLVKLEVRGGRALARALVIALAAVLLVGCGSLTSRENADLIAEFDDIVDYDRPPVLINAVSPEYPDIVREVGAEGRVIIKVLVLEDGTLGAVQIVESPNDILANQAISALRKSEFRPAIRDGRPCCATTLVPFVFDSGKAGVGTRDSYETGRKQGMYGNIEVERFKSTVEEVTQKK
jgi:TonB family protein